MRLVTTNTILLATLMLWISAQNTVRAQVRTVSRSMPVLNDLKEWGLKGKLKKICFIQTDDSSLLQSNADFKTLQSILGYTEVYYNAAGYVQKICSVTPVSKHQAIADTIVTQYSLDDAGSIYGITKSQQAIVSTQLKKVKSANSYVVQVFDANNKLQTRTTTWLKSNGQIEKQEELYFGSEDSLAPVSMSNIFYNFSAKGGLKRIVVSDKEIQSIGFTSLNIDQAWDAKGNPIKSLKYSAEDPAGNRRWIIRKFEYYP
ncbi:MAG: hypothetical protein RLY16_1750 [Bacteroidota bacterium]|jgi:hypothetical protein